MPYTICPGCDEDIYIPKRPRLGDIITCRSCEAELEVVSTNPLELDFFLGDDDVDYDEEEEDEDEFYDEDEDDDDL